MRTILAVVICAAFGFAQVPVRILSTSPEDVAVWVTVPVPYRDAQELGDFAIFETADSRFPAVRGPTVGYQTVFFDVLLANLPARGRVPGKMVSAEPGQRPPTTTFEASVWVVDDVSRLIPSYRLRADGVVYQCEPSQFILQHQSPARQSWTLISRCGPLVLQLWATIWTAQDVVEWQLFAVNSNPDSEAVQITIESLQVTWGEPVLVDDALPLGIPAARWDSSLDTWTVDLVSDPIAVGDAQGLPIIKGALLCTDSTRPWYYHLFSSVPEIRARVGNLIARAGGAPIAGTDWTGRWLAFQAAIEPGSSDRAEMLATYEAQISMMQSPQHLFAQRARGLNKNAGSAGSQEDFGASRGGELVLGELLFGTTWAYHTQESLRPIHYREIGGWPVWKSVHPNWWTWSQLTHWHCGVSPDRLGKPCPEPRHNTHGWGGKDDQHVSSNNLHATIAAFDWPAHRMLMGDEIRVAQANVRFLDGQTPGAPRAVGRRMLQNANQWTLTGREGVWTGLVVWHGRNAYEKSFLSVPEFRLQAGPTTDPRVMVDPGSGEPVPAIVVWQEGLAMNGLAAGWAAHRYRLELGLPKHPDTHFIGDQLVGIATTLVRHYFAEGEDGWQTWLNVRWTGGPPDPQLIAGSENVPGLIRDRIDLASGWFDWIGPGLYYLARADHGLGIPGDVAERLDSIFTEWEGEVLPTASIHRRQWFAVVQR